MKYNDNFFNVVTMFDLVEYVIDSTTLLKEINKIIKKECPCIIVTSDIDSLRAKIF
jgi:2-polyprenyl-3-methyl-5-hydroxy-6-metoxy-1,4-benzoquinol methylase